MQRITDNGGVFIDGDPATSTLGTPVTAAWLQTIQEEISGLVESTGGVLNPADNTQVKAAIAKIVRGLTTFTAAVAGGTANAITATYTPAIAALGAGLSVFVRAAAANTIVAPTFAPNGLTAKAIVKGAGSALVAGDIAGAGHWLELQFDATLDKWVLQNPAVPVASAIVAGLIELATAAEAQGLSDTVRALTPSTLAAALQGSNQSLVASGYQKIPGGLIIQWGTFTGTADVAVGAARSVTLPITFPNAFYSVSLTTIDNFSSDCIYGAFPQTLSTLGYFFLRPAGSASFGGYFIAIGR